MAASTSGIVHRAKAQSASSHESSGSGIDRPVEPDEPDRNR